MIAFLLFCPYYFFMPLKKLEFRKFWQAFAKNRGQAPTIWRLGSGLGFGFKRDLTPVLCQIVGARPHSIANACQNLRNSRKKVKLSAEEQAKAWGINVSLIEANLKRTPDERLEVLQQTLDTIFELRKAWSCAQHQNYPSKTSGKRR